MTSPPEREARAMAIISSGGGDSAARPPRKPSATTAAQVDGFTPSAPAEPVIPKPQPPMEKELKYALPGQGGYEALKRKLGEPAETLHQTNAYLVSPTSAGSRNSVLRVRQENETYFLTLKLDGTNQDGYQQSQEYEVEIASAAAARIQGGQATDEDWQLSPLQKFAETFGREPLTKQGELHNLRLGYPLPTGETLELDCLTLPNGRVDFEMECETTEPGPVKEHLKSVLQELGLDLVPQKKSKYKRFLECLA